MKLKITGREIALFIAKFKLWDAYLNKEDIDGDCIDLHAPGYGCNECNYALYSDGKYEIYAWIEERGYWEKVKRGDIFGEDK